MFPGPEAVDLTTNFISIWIADTARDQSFRIDGLDISLEQCPAAEMLPKGCSIRKVNILQNVPADLIGIYDIIHVRLILGGLGDDPVPALKNFIAMLSMRLFLTFYESGIL